MKANIEILNKIIFAKRKSVSKETMVGILDLEIQSHLSKNPHLTFLNVGEVVTNSDLSKTYPLIFQISKEQPQKAAIN